LRSSLRPETVGVGIVENVLTKLWDFGAPAWLLVALALILLVRSVVSQIAKIDPLLVDALTRRMLVRWMLRRRARDAQLPDAALEELAREVLSLLFQKQATAEMVEPVVPSGWRRIWRRLLRSSRRKKRRGTTD